MSLRKDLRNAAVSAVLALLALAVGHELIHEHPHLDGWRIAAYGCAVAVVVFGTLTTRWTAAGLSVVAAARGSVEVMTPVRLMVQVVGYLLTVMATLTVLDVDLSQFLVGGALTGVVLGIAAQQALGNFFAGLVLLLARPYAVGETVTVFSGAINGPHVGVVDTIGLLYTEFRTGHGPLRIPNSVLLGSAVAPGEHPVPPSVEAQDS